MSPAGGRRRDPLGKRALFWAGESGEAGASPADAPGATAALGPERPPARPARGRGAGRRALYSASSATAEQTVLDDPEVVSDDPVISRGPVRVGCPSCKITSRVGFLDFVLFQAPVGFWLPRGRYAHRMTCPACRRRVWASVSLRG